MCTEDIVRHIITGFGIGTHGIHKKFSLRRSWQYFQFCGKSLFHILIIPQNCRKRNIRSHKNKYRTI